MILLFRAFLKVPVATRLDILRICLDGYEGVNRKALHSASISRNTLKNVRWAPCSPPKLRQGCNMKGHSGPKSYLIPYINLPPSRGGLGVHLIPHIAFT